MIELSDEQIVSLLWHGDVSQVTETVAATDLLVLHELLDHALQPHRVLSALLSSMSGGAWIAVVYRDNSARTARLLRRWWTEYAAGRTSFFSRDNVVELARRSGGRPRLNFEVWTRQTISTAVYRFSRRLGASALLRSLDFLKFKAPVGRSVTMVEVQNIQNEKLSIVIPAFNEKRYVSKVLEALIGLELPIEKELIIVESNSTDGTRDIVKAFAGAHPGVKLILEDGPRGKGHAVRAGLQEATGSVILIQDADFEYDIEDYDALLRPILARRAEFVLGSRTLGLGGWKVRRYTNTPVKGCLINFAHVVFAKTYNILFNQRATDINTMFKVFRRSCLSHFELTSNGFDLDIELACKLAAAGFAPNEVPVNYRSRGFEDGKKIRFFHDAFRTYLMLFRCRFFKTS